MLKNSLSHIARITMAAVGNGNKRRERNYYFCISYAPPVLGLQRKLIGIADGTDQMSIY